MTYHSNYKKNWLFSLLFSLFFASLLSANSIQFIDGDLKSVQNIAAKEDKLFFIYYGADWCMPCKWMEENTFLDPNLINYVNSEFIALKADISTAKGRILKKQFEISNIPSILVFAASGKLIDQKTSSMEAHQMLAWLEQLNRPENHIHQTQILAIDSNFPSLESPRHYVDFQRPSLIPEDSPAGLLAELEEDSQQNFHQPTLTVASNSNFTPRSTLRYGIKLEDRTFTYQMAVREVLLLEEKYGEPTELSPEANQLLSIIIGNFETTGKAQVFLNFLNRNNLKGKVIVLNRSYSQ